MDELWTMWDRGERDGHALSFDQRAEIERLAAAGHSVRAIARTVGRGRRAVRSYVGGNTDGLRSARWRLKKMRLRVLNEETREFETGHIAAVVDKGVQPVYRLTLADGKELTCTENHRLLTTSGWRTMRAAIGLVGDGEQAHMSKSCALLTNGVPAHQNAEWLRERRTEGKSVSEIAAEAGCSYHTVRKWLRVHRLQFERGEAGRGRKPWNRGLQYTNGMRMSDDHKNAIRRARSGARNNFWRGGISSQRANVGRWTREQAPRVHERFDYTCQRCGLRGGRLHAHHVVPVWLAPERALDFANLTTICNSCHRSIHRTIDSELAFARHYDPVIDFSAPKQRPTKGWKLTAREVDVVGVTYVGLKRTYDLCVDGPWHNFVANGVVVHNSFNEFSMRYARATDDFYVPEAADVRTQVGKPGAYSFDPVDPEVAETTREELRAVYETAYAAYERLVELGVARELARSVLPVGAYTEFYWTVNARALMNFVSLRAADTAQREIRRYAEAVEQLFAERMPITHAAFVASGRVAP